jgi:hypothetical protein
MAAHERNHLDQVRALTACIPATRVLFLVVIARTAFARRGNPLFVEC